MNQFERFYNRSKDYLFRPAFDRYWRQRLYGRVICLLYHRVDLRQNNNFLTSGGSPVISPAELEEEVRFLREQGAMFLTFADLRKGAFPGPSEFGAIISFDDCFLDNYTNGLEVLEKMEVKSVFFQTTGMVEAENLIWEHALYWLIRNDEGICSFTALAHRILGHIPGVRERRGRELVEFLREQVPALSVEHLLSHARQQPGVAEGLQEAAERAYPKASHLREAQRLGHEIGSHSHRHYKRSNIDEKTFESELGRSFEALTNMLGRKPGAFSYPFNSHHEGDKQICAKYFLQGVTVERAYIDRQSDPMWLPRFTWPGTAKSSSRRRRWLLTGRI